MRRTALALSTAAGLVGVLLAAPVAAQDSRSARGTVTALAGNTLTIKAADRDMTFTVDAKTSVIVRGGSTATRKAEAAGEAGPKLAALVKVGDPVEVSFRETDGAMRATMIRRVTSVGTGGISAATEDSEGTVEAVTASSLTISGSESGGTFTQTFMIDGGTTVIGVGAGTAAAAKGGKMVITDYVSKGDQVAVRYDLKGDRLHAVDVRVRVRAK
jgi:hypothetical protein